MWFGKPNKHKSISGESFIPKPGGLSARGGLPAFCLGRDSGRILARALVLFGADAVELFKRPAEVGAVLVPHRHGNVPDFLPAARAAGPPLPLFFSREERHGFFPGEERHGMQKPLRRSQLTASNAAKGASFVAPAGFCLQLPGQAELEKTTGDVTPAPPLELFL